MHNSKPNPCLSDEAMSRRPIISHAGKRSVGTDFSDPDTVLQEANPSAGSGAGTAGYPTTGPERT